ncbi:MAG: phage tail domain-containing protein [Liquorilactobacillus ghanensis]|uniref:phage tail domain-containing protein n=1 Tax=Liquorilactobacillus ghanensis TaxID=399370 RepID=UPI0039E7F471
MQAATVLIQKQDGTVINLRDRGIIVNSFTVPPTNWQYTWQQVGKFNNDLTSITAQQREIVMTLSYLGKDYYDFEMLRVELNSIFNSKEPFYVIWTMLPYLRYKVVLDNSNTDLTQYDRLPQFAGPVTFYFLDVIGFAESTATTQTPFTYDAGAWGLANILPEAVEVPYTFTTPNFKVYNASIIPLRAEEHPVTLTFSGEVAKSLSIQNVTTGQTFTLNRALTASDSLIIKGLVPIVNGSQDYGASNHAYLDLAVGWNEFKITGASKFKLDIDTHFYY